MPLHHVACFDGWLDDSLYVDWIEIDWSTFQQGHDAKLNWSLAIQLILIEMTSYQMNQSIYDNALQLRFATFSKSNIQTIKQSLNHLKSWMQPNYQTMVRNLLQITSHTLKFPYLSLFIFSLSNQLDQLVIYHFTTLIYIVKSAFSPCLRTRPINNKDHFKSRCCTLLKSANEIMFAKAAVDHSFHSLISKLAFVWCETKT